MLGRGGDRVRHGIVEIEALDSDFLLETGDILRSPRRGKHRQPRVFRVCAAQSPMPDEQPVIRIDLLMPAPPSP
jgi:hypothetical protein